MKTIVTYLLISTLTVVPTKAQTTASSTMTATPWAPIVDFDLAGEGEEQVVRWGIDTAWRWSWWPLRATNHMSECVSLGRVTIDPRIDADYTTLSDGQRAGLDEQLEWLAKSGVKELYLLSGNTAGKAWTIAYRSPFVADIANAVTYLQSKGYTVTAISPFNEPDYGANNAPAAAEMANVARLMHQNSTLANIDIAGPSTLNPDYGLSWWNTMKDAVQIGNTHQLAGSFDSFAAFYAAVKAAGKPSADDELHNINDALIGMNYGMRDGIWWSDFGGYTRAELGRASLDGERIGYKENRSAWTSAAVFRRHSGQMAEAFLGSSERQAGESSYTFVSQDRLAYFDGNGPYYEYNQPTKGGTGYQTGQTNSEGVVEITWGEDIPMTPLNGTFKIVNKATGRLLSASTLSGGATVSQQTEATSRNQSWIIEPIDYTAHADFSYVTIRNAKATTYYLDAEKWGASNGAKVIVYGGSGNECERWHLRYMGDGYYVITNHDSGLSLEGSSNNTAGVTSSVVQWARTGTDRQLWRLVPADAKVETDPPAAPAGLSATPKTGSITLQWQENADTDLLGYMVCRYNERAGIWEIIGRCIKDTTFIDNICAKNKTYRYRIRAIDKAWNRSEPSAEVTAQTIVQPSLIGHWPLTENLDDITGNCLHAVGQANTFAATDTHSGINLDGGNTGYVSLPYHVADMEQLTFSAWVKPTASTAWQRIFDFGRSTDNYLFLTPSNGSRLRFEICKDGTKQGLNATRRLTAGAWTHVTLTISSTAVSIYLDGQLNATSTDISLRPTDIGPTLSYIGRSMFDADPLFKGTIGDVRIYNYALDAEQIKSLYYADQIDAARLLASKPMYSDSHSALLQAIDDVENIVQSNDDDQIKSALAALSTAMTKAKTSVTAYMPLGEALQWSGLMADKYPQQSAEAQAQYSEQYSAEMQKYSDGTFTNVQVGSEVVVVKTFTNQYLMADAALTATEQMPVEVSHLLANNDFADGSIDGWTLTTNSSSGYTGACNYGLFEVWNHSFTLQQVLYGMPSGTYRLDTQAFYRNGTKANSGNTDVNSVLFVNSQTAAIAPISAGANSLSGAGDWYSYESNRNVPNDMHAAATAFNTMRRYRPTTTVNTVTAEFDNTVLSRMTLGMRKTRVVNDDWTIMNYFKLYYLGHAEADGIGSIDAGVAADGVENGHTIVYDLMGRLLHLAVGESLAPGIYIVGGRKMVVK